MYIGDSKTDMLTGRMQGWITIGVTWGFRDKQELQSNGAVYIVDRPEENSGHSLILTSLGRARRNEKKRCSLLDQNSEGGTYENIIGDVMRQLIN